MKKGGSTTQLLAVIYENNNSCGTMPTRCCFVRQAHIQKPLTTTLEQLDFTDFSSFEIFEAKISLIYLTNTNNNNNLG